MVNVWWLLIFVLFWLVSLIWQTHISYTHGIWDGAFNQFLPRVREEIMRYDPHRGKQILEKYDAGDWISCADKHNNGVFDADENEETHS